MSTQLFPILEARTAEVQEAGLPLYREVAWDFEAGRPLFRGGEPVIVTGKEALKSWIYKALLTQRGRYEIYTRNFGSDLETLVGQNYTVHTKRSEAMRYVREALAVNPYITGVGDLQVDFGDGTLSLRGQVQTIYGEMEVNADV